MIFLSFVFSPLADKYMWVQYNIRTLVLTNRDVVARVERPLVTFSANVRPPSFPKTFHFMLALL